MRHVHIDIKVRLSIAACLFGIAAVLNVFMH